MGTDLSAALKFRLFKTLKRYFSLGSNVRGGLGLEDSQERLYQIGVGRGKLIAGLAGKLGLLPPKALIIRRLHETGGRSRRQETGELQS
jgi:hypothetical protein